MSIHISNFLCNFAVLKDTEHNKPLEVVRDTNQAQKDMIKIKKNHNKKFADKMCAMFAMQSFELLFLRQDYYMYSRCNTHGKILELSVFFDLHTIPVLPRSYQFSRSEITSTYSWNKYTNQGEYSRTITYYFDYFE